MNDYTNRGEHPRALDRSVFAAADPIERAALAVVAITIEAERERLRSELGKARMYFSDRGFFPASMDAVDAMSWEDLLKRREVLQRCAAATKTEAAEIVRMVREYCKPSNPDALFWMGGFYDLDETLPRMIAKALAPHVQVAKANERLVKEGAGRGGVKSGLTRRLKSSLPSPENLRIEANKRVDGGLGRRDVASVLAKRYSVTAKTIRENLKKAEEDTGSAAKNKRT